MTFEILGGVLPFAVGMGFDWMNDANPFGDGFAVVIINVLEPHED